jgi:hypothetical protein
VKGGQVKGGEDGVKAYKSRADEAGVAQARAAGVKEDRQTRPRQSRTKQPEQK